MNDVHMTIDDKCEFLRESLSDVVIFDDTESGYVSAMFEIYHIAQDERFPMFIRNAIGVVFAELEDGNWDANNHVQELAAEATKARAELNLSNVDSLAKTG